MLIYHPQGPKELQRKKVVSVQSLKMYKQTHSGRRKWQPTPVFLPREFHGQRSLAGYCPWGCTESDSTEVMQQQQQQTHSVSAIFLEEGLNGFGFP